jgi:acyl-coenzyme A thioesterase 13
MEIINLETLKILQIQNGFLRCSFTVTSDVSGEDGNWHPGAIATLIDVIGGSVIHSACGIKKASVEFGVSFFSTAKTHEEVILEGKINGEKGKLSSILVEVRRKDNGELIALGKQWMTSNNIEARASSKL